MNKKNLFLFSILCSNYAFSTDINENFEKRMLKEYTGQAKIKQKDDSINKRYNSEDGQYFLSSYKQNYFLPFNYSNDYNNDYLDSDQESKNLEAAFQISVKYPLAFDITPVGGDLYFTYTNKSNWQLYSEDEPFRETSHEPELLVDFGQDWEFGGIQNTNILIGYNHQTNGKAGEEERSWDRIFADAIFAHKDYSLSVRAWLPFSENNGGSNHEFSDYIGHHELNGRYYYEDQTISLKTTWAFGEGHTGVTVGWAKPLTKALSAYVEGFYGYGDTMIDFDKKVERISVGFIFTNDLF